ncbi:MAG: hypothetical protein AB8B99_12850 [Phormidesmis sp.]
MPGRKDLHNGDFKTVGALLIAIASTHLTDAGLSFPKIHLVSDPELTLYEYLQNSLDSFYNALKIANFA